MNPARLSELTIQQGYRLLVEASSEIAWSADLEGRLTFLNRGVQRVLGYEPDELLGRPLGWIQPPDCAARDAALLGRVLAGATLADHETRALRRDGATVELGIDAFPLFDERGAIVGAIGIARDLTERHRAERVRLALADMGRWLGAVRSPDEAARIIVRVAQEILHWDACSLDLYSPESGMVQAVLSMDSFGGPPVDVPHAYTATAPGPMTARVLRDGPQLILRAAARPTPDGLVPFGNTARPSRSLLFVPVRHGDRVTGILSIQSYTPNAYGEHDLATLQELADHCGGALERLRIENALRESQLQLARTEAFSLVMTAHLRLDGTWLKVPASLCRLLGHDEAALLGTSISALLHPDDVDVELVQRERLLRGETRSFDLETRWRRRGGGVVWMYANCSVVLDGGGQPLYLLLYLRDITERRSLEEQLRQALKMEAVGQLAGGVAHDFNNLLTAILGCTELLLTATPPADPRREDIAEIGHAAHRAASLVRQLLAFSRKQVLQPRLLSLNEIVGEMGGMLRRVVGERILLRLDLDPELGQVMADPGQLEQVIANLGVNARDAMPDGGRLTIATANVTGSPLGTPGSAFGSGGPLVALSVSDTGVGMDEHVLAHLFEPFFTTKELGRGTGLGLATVYGIVRQSGGQVQVWSRPNEGSTFTVYLPRVDTLPDAPLPRPVEAVPGGSETILVVEDEEAVRHLVCRVLRGKGYRVLEAAHGEEALAIAADEAESIDLLVTDMVMPGLDGSALAREMVRARPSLRVVFITGYALEAIEHPGDLAHNGALLEKPFTADQLARKVREALAAVA